MAGSSFRCAEADRGLAGGSRRVRRPDLLRVRPAVPGVDLVTPSISAPCATLSLSPPRMPQAGTILMQPNPGVAAVQPMTRAGSEPFNVADIPPVEGISDSSLPA